MEESSTTTTTTTTNNVEWDEQYRFEFKTNEGDSQFPDLALSDTSFDSSSIIDGSFGVGSSFGDASFGDASFGDDSLFNDPSFADCGSFDAIEWPSFNQEATADGDKTIESWAVSGENPAGTDFNMFDTESSEFPSFSMLDFSDSFSTLQLDGDENPFQTDSVSFFEGEGIASPKIPSHVPASTNESDK